MIQPYYDEGGIVIYHGDALTVLRSLPDESIQCCVTSPPYWGLRDYGTEGQLGLEPTPDAYVSNLVAVFREVRRLLKQDGTLWMNLGDSYNANTGSGFNAHSQTRPHLSGEGVGQKRIDEKNRNTIMKRPPWLKPKDLVGIPWMVAFALRADGWYLRSDIIWHKKNPMPESVQDRPTKAHEYLFLLAKSEKYYYDAEAIREPHTADLRMPGGNSRVYQDRDPQHPSTRKLEPLQGAHGTMGHDGNGMRMPEKWNNPAGRNKRSVWTIATQPYPEAHFATFPPKLIEPCILAGSRPGDIALDPFLGSGTTVQVAKGLNRQCLGIELNAAYLPLTINRLRQEVLPL